MGYQDIAVERIGDDQSIVKMTLNRPEKLNALTFPMLKEMREVFEEIRFDRSVRVLVVTGAGRGFCSGMDHAGGATGDHINPKDGNPNPGAPDPEGERMNFHHETKTFKALRELDIPIIAGINGPCVGAGFDLACLADLALASSSARYQVAYVKRGLYADLGGFWAIPKIIGWRLAMEMMFTGRFLSAEEGHEAGVTNYLVDDDEFDSKLEDFAKEVASGPPIGQKVGKLMAYKTMSMDYERALDLSAMVLALVTLSEDRAEGVRAFLEKRDGSFSGF